VKADAFKQPLPAVHMAWRIDGRSIDAVKVERCAAGDGDITCDQGDHAIAGA
jgi:hypothetical protein